MAILINSYHEQDEHLESHPHECSARKKGQWVVVGQKLTETGIDRLNVRCKDCGHEAIFEFDVISMIVPEVSERMRALRVKD